MNLENQKQIEGNVRQYYEILRSRQLQIIGIIKDTTELLEKINSSPNVSEISNEQLETNLDNEMHLAFGMINALANILDEQMKALNIWERLLIDETSNAAKHSEVDYEYQDYYEIRTN